MSTVVGDGPDRYISRPDGSSSWTVKEDELDEWIASLQKKAEAQQERINNIDFQMSNPAISARNLISKTLKSEMKKSPNSTFGNWSVKVHADTGQT
jgi:hypothetical protein